MTQELPYLAPVRRHRPHRAGLPASAAPRLLGPLATDRRDDAGLPLLSSGAFPSSIARALRARSIGGTHDEHIRGCSRTATSAAGREWPGVVHAWMHPPHSCRYVQRCHPHPPIADEAPGTRSPSISRTPFSVQRRSPTHSDHSTYPCFRRNSMVCSITRGYHRLFCSRTLKKPCFAPSKAETVQWLPAFTIAAQKSRTC